MRNSRGWKEKYEILEADYNKIFAEKMELEYRSNILEKNYSHEKEQGEEILKLHENARRLKHDMKNHLMVMTAYLNENQIEEAKKYLSQILDKLNNMYTYIETGNTLMSHILNAKLEEAHKRRIYIKANIENLSFSKVSSVDFASILTNLLDNAIEGVKGENPTISVEIARKRGYEIILIKNTIAVSVLERNPILKFTKEKKELHGCGTAQIKLLTEKYGGLCDFYEEEGMFCACVMIPYD
jgi:sensor histidine kinase regulating citrate/malate metabolism